jgi:hypothetical protein
MAAQDSPDPAHRGATDESAPRRLRLRDLFEAARVEVQTDPGAAIADYQQSLLDLIAARRARGD